MGGEREGDREGQAESVCVCVKEGGAADMETVSGRALVFGKWKSFTI